MRRKARELALQVLYQSELAGLDGLAAFDSYIGHFDANKRAMGYARQLVAGVVGHVDELNRLVEAHSANWRMSRMSVIDRNILRIAAFEIAMDEDVPARVAINEALEIARRFSTDESVPFINGILDAINRQVNCRRQGDDRPEGDD